MTNEETKKLKVAVVGSSNFNESNKEALYEVLDKNADKIEMIISGGSNIGADSIGRLYAKDRGLPCLILYPNYYPSNGQYDKGASFKRNIEMIKESDVIVAVWDGVSRGTGHFLEMAKKSNKKIKIIHFEGKNNVDEVKSA